MSILKVDKLTVRFGGLTAVSDVSFEVQPGQIFSLIGPNGAGKTTVFNAITGIYEPTTGQVLFEGHSLRRPISWRVVLGCLTIGLFTALTLAILSVNVDSLWWAVVKREHTLGVEKFSPRTALRDTAAYVRGDLTIARSRGNRWEIVSADGKTRFDEIEGRGQDPAAIEASYQAARAQLAGWQTLMQASGIFGGASLGGSRSVEIHPVGSAFGLFISGDQEPRAVVESRREAERCVESLRIIAEQHEFPEIELAGWFLLGLALGSSGAFVVWNRARRTPDVIARGGIARTFQNIRLFANMTVLENVMVAEDRQHARGMLAAIFRTPGFRRGQNASRDAARAELEFVGLAGVAAEKASALPYGDQRRLEIARALATHPRLLLLDEPAAGMNPAETSELTALVRRIRERGLTVLLIEHHMKVVMGISDRIAVLDHGAKIAEGTPDEVRRNPLVVEAYLGKEELG